MTRYKLLSSQLLLCLLAACSNGSRIATQEITAPTTTIPATEPSKPIDESLTIAFDEGGTTLSAQAGKQLDTAARLYRDAKPEVMIIAGHSDRVGAEYENLILSARRAALIKKALTDRGIPAERLQIMAVGEAEPIVGITPSRTAIVTWR